MFVRRLMGLAALLCVSLVAGCEGDAGPMGPAGASGEPGPSVILCYGEIAGRTNPAVVTSSWPSDVTVEVADDGDGLWNITMTGTFPAEEGVFMGAVTDNNAARTITAYTTAWSDSLITCRVGVWSTIDSRFFDADFSFMVLANR